MEIFCLCYDDLGGRTVNTIADVLDEKESKFSDLVLDACSG